MFVPLRRGLRVVREIVLTPLDENNEEIKKLKYTIEREIIFYRQLPIKKLIFTINAHSKSYLSIHSSFYQC